MATKISYIMAFLVGIAMIFLGARFFFSPEAATADFGIRFNSFGDYSFQHIKGARDIFSGILLCAFVLMNQRIAVAVTMLAGTIIPLNDMLIVLSKPYAGVAQAMPHIIANIACFVFGLLLILTKRRTKVIGA
jgi:hypothetical protein